MGWIADRFRGAIESGVEGLIWKAIVFGAITLAGVLLAAVLLLARAADEEVPTWSLALTIGVAIGLSVAYGFRARRWTLEIDDLEWQLALSGYSRTLHQEALQTLQKVLNGDIKDVSVDAFIEQGILELGREFLQRGPGEEVRLSVLVPDGSDFLMKWAAGHRLESKQKFRRPIAELFSKIAYETGELTWSADVDQDDRFTPIPVATRPYKSLVSVPLRAGGTVIGVLNGISTYPDAFSEVDIQFIELLGSIVDVVWAARNGFPVRTEE